MNIKPTFNYFKLLAKKPQELKANKYVRISPELNKVSSEIFNYLNEVKPDLIAFAKSNKVRVNIAPRENHIETLQKFNMEFLKTNVEYLKKIKSKPFHISSFMDTNSRDSVFGVFPYNSGKIVPFKENPVPFKDSLLSHLKLVLEALERTNKI